MVGIDIVDLSDPLLKSRDDRSLRLIVHPDDHYQAFFAPFWPLWTAKEATFKALRDDKPFRPHQISVWFDLNDNQGTFASRFQQSEFHGKIVLNQSYCLAMVRPLNQRCYYQVFSSQPDNWSEEIRRLTSTYFEHLGQVIDIGRDSKNLPFIKDPMAPISFSHHFQLGAFICPAW